MPRSRLFAVLFASMLALGVLAPPIQAQEATASPQEAVESPDAILYVDGLACPFCAYGLEKKLDDIEAIDDIEVQVEESRIFVLFREEERASEEDLRRAVEDAGFSARKIEFPNEEASGHAQ